MRKFRVAASLLTDKWGDTLMMMRTAVTAVILLGLLAAPASAAQGKGKKNGRVPPGHLPQAGQCRVWYDGVPPGHQPGPTSCSEAERIAARDRNARVIYGSDRGRRDRDDDRWERDDDRNGRERGRAVPRRDGYPGGYPDSVRYPDRGYPDRRGGYGYQSVPFENGREDGLAKGREDARDRDRYDPARHGWYRSGDRGYNSRHGSREDYRSGYREGFLAGYEEAYRRDDAGTRSGDRRPSWWPF